MTIDVCTTLRSSRLFITGRGPGEHLPNGCLTRGVNSASLMKGLIEPTGGATRTNTNGFIAIYYITHIHTQLYMYLSLIAPLYTHARTHARS